MILEWKEERIYNTIDYALIILYKNYIQVTELNNKRLN